MNDNAQRKQTFNQHIEVIEDAQLKLKRARATLAGAFRQAQSDGFDTRAMRQALTEARLPEAAKRAYTEELTLYRSWLQEDGND